MPLWQILVLAVVQGLTEFLPVSSSGHLVVLAHLMAGGDAEALEVADVNIVLHLGTLAAIVLFYWRRILSLLGPDRRAIGLLALATAPAVLAGLPVKLWAEHLLEDPLLAGWLLIATGGVVWAAGRAPRGEETYVRLGWGRALGIGVSQAAAVLPGLSRSGMTIAAGLLAGLAPAEAATFSFLLALPAIGGAGLLEAASALGDAPQHTPPLHLALGALTAMAVGWLSLRWLVRWLETGRLQRFAWWCVPLGTAVVIWRLFG